MEFNYRAITSNKNSVSGTIEAVDSRSAHRELVKKGMIPTAIESNIKKQQKISKKKLSSVELRLTLQQLVTLIKSGITLNEAITSLAESSQHPFLSQQLKNISNNLKQGNSFSQALSKSSLSFPQYFYQLVDAGELTGKLGDALADALDQMVYEEEINKSFRQALIYPSILVISGISAVIIIFVMVVPKFSNLLEKSDQLPWLAWLVLSTGKFFNEQIVVISTIALLLTGGSIFLLKQEKIRRYVYDFLARLPVIGQWLKESDIARWSKLLAVLIENNVSLIKSFELSNKSIKISWLKNHLTQATVRIKDGNTLYTALKEASVFTAIGLDLIKVGEKTGKLADMLHALSTLYIQSSQNRMKQFLLLIEPIAILLIGGVIGIIMTGVILAITSLNEVAI